MQISQVALTHSWVAGLSFLCRAFCRQCLQRIIRLPLELAAAGTTKKAKADSEAGAGRASAAGAEGASEVGAERASGSGAASSSSKQEGASEAGAERASDRQIDDWHSFESMSVERCVAVLGCCE